MSLLIFNKKNKSLLPGITEIFSAPDDFLGTTPKLRGSIAKTGEGNDLESKRNPKGFNQKTANQKNAGKQKLRK